VTVASRLPFLALAAALACAPVPRPGILAEVDRTRSAPASQEAAALAPQAYLAAERLRADATKAYDGGDRAGAQLLAEQALAAYVHAHVLSRLARADGRLEAATKKLVEEQRAFSGVDEQQRKVAAEADDLELRVRVARDAVTPSPTEPASADREHARLLAARALAMDARLLCIAAQMLSPAEAASADAFKALDALDGELDKSPAHPPIDTAVRLRAACLAALTEARRPNTEAAPEAGAPDALLDELSKAALEPSRDDRGVAVAMRDLFDGAGLKPPAKERLAALGQVAKAHPTFPVLVVMHGSHGRPVAADTDRANAIAQALRAAGASHVEAKAVGDALPVAPPMQPKTRNERAEIVFVAPAR
jgi:hypothetical protein